MSLKVSNLATAKQIAMLHKLDYIGTGKYAAERLTMQEAADLIEELLTDKKEEQFNQDYMGTDPWGN